MRLAEGIGNEDDLLGVPGGVEMNFFQSKFIRRSLMPEGLIDALPDQSVADLLAYLMTLKG